MLMVRGESYQAHSMCHGGTGEEGGGAFFTRGSLVLRLKQEHNKTRVPITANH